VDPTKIPYSAKVLILGGGKKGEKKLGESIINFTLVWKGRRERVIPIAGSHFSREGCGSAYVGGVSRPPTPEKLQRRQKKKKRAAKARGLFPVGAFDSKRGEKGFKKALPTTLGS